VPVAPKSAFITPLPKKPDLSSDDPRSYRPIQLVGTVETTRATCLPAAVQLPRQGGSSTTSVIRVPGPPLYRDCCSQLRSSPTFCWLWTTAICPFSRYSTCQRPSDILLTRLCVSYGVGGPVLEWFRSYLTGRVECIRRGMSRSTPITVRFGVPQRSVLGPLLFILYTADLIDIIEAHGLHSHLYADDTQIQGSCCLDSVDSLSLLCLTVLTRCQTGCIRIGYN